MMTNLSLNANITTSLPLQDQVGQIGMIQIMLNAILATITAFLGILCMQLIYSLMLSDVDEKTFEYGMLRALGFSKDNVFATVVISGMTFAIPGIVLGLSIALILNYGIRLFLYKLVENESTYWLSESSIWLGVALGLVLPLAANIIPIMKALSKNLRASLDMYHRSVDGLSVSMKTAQNYGLSVNQFICAVMLVVMGVLTYYVAPTAFLYQKYELFFEIMNAILLLMILGMTFVAILLLPILQGIVLRCFLFCFKKDRKLERVIVKNL